MEYRSTKYLSMGEYVNLMPYDLFNKMGKWRTDQVELEVNTTTRSTLFMVINYKANFNLLLGREWIHGIGAVPSTLHQRISIWRQDGVVENIEAD